MLKGFPSLADPAYWHKNKWNEKGMIEKFMAYSKSEL